MVADELVYLKKRPQPWGYTRKDTSPRHVSFTSMFFWGGHRLFPFTADSSPTAVRSVPSSAPSPPRSKKSARALTVRSIVEGWVSAWSSSTNVARVRSAKPPLSWRYRAPVQGWQSQEDESTFSNAQRRSNIRRNQCITRGISLGVIA